MKGKVSELKPKKEKYQKSDVRKINVSDSRQKKKHHDEAETETEKAQLGSTRVSRLRNPLRLSDTMTDRQRWKLLLLL